MTAIGTAKLRAGGVHERGMRPAALTAHAGPEDRIRVLSGGYQRYVRRPVEPAELVAVLASLAGGSNPT
jgi:CheY-like chemotaxis protein